MEFILIIGILCVVAFFCTCGLLEEILMRLMSRKANEAPEETPEQLFLRKCCNCPAFGICTKGTIEEIKECDG